VREIQLNLTPFKKLISLDSVSSTMDVAFKISQLGERFFVVSAEEQWAGKGKGNRRWYSDRFSLSFSIAIDGKFLYRQSLLSILAGVIVKKGIVSYLGIPIELKWPNDIVFKGKKLGGILGENWNEFIIIGIGINVNNLEFPCYLESAISLRQIQGREIDKVELLKSIIKEFSLDFNLFAEGNDILIKEWKKSCTTIGERVKFKSYNNIKEGIVTDIANDGALLVSLSDGRRKKIYSSDELVTER